MIHTSSPGYMYPPSEIAQNHLCVLPCGGVTGHDVYEWSQSRLRYYVHYYVDGRPVDRLFNGFVFNAISTNETHMIYPMYVGFGSPANKDDWMLWLDSLFAKGVNLEALYALAVQSPVDVWVSIPYPYPDNKNFGEINGRTLDFSIEEDRFAAVEWWIDEFRNRFARDPKLVERLQLRGFLWQRPSIHNYDVELVQRTNLRIRKEGLLSLWLPYYGSYGCVDWQSFHFDLVAYHPNYYGNTPYTYEWIKNAAVTAKFYSTGMQIVYGKGLIYNQTHLFDYLNLGLPEFHDYMRQSFLVYQFPNHTLEDIYRRQFVQYARLYTFIKGLYVKTLYTGAPYQ